jgi:Mg2+ and Co2+ transporter CorA
MYVIDLHIQKIADLSSVANSFAIQKCHQCQESFADALAMPKFWWSKYFRDGNGGFGCESTRRSGVVTGFSKYTDSNYVTALILLDTWSRFTVKQVKPDASFTWYYTNLFTRWLTSTGQTVVLAFDMQPPIQGRCLRALMHPDPSLLSDPFWAHPYLMEQIARAQEPSVWGIRDHVRASETEKKPEGRPQPDYRRLHDIARHAIHVNETLDATMQSLEYLMIEHEYYKNLTPENATSASEDIHRRLRFFQSFIANLRSRSISNEKRLQNEIQLAFNTVAQHDSSITLEIGRATQLDSATMKTIAFVTLTFLPPTFICAIFSMSFFNYGPDTGWNMSSNFWIYWVFAIPTTVITTVLWTYWGDIRDMVLPKKE